MRLVAAVLAFSIITTLHVTETLGNQSLNELKRKKIEDDLANINNALINISNDLTKVKEDVKKLTCNQVFKSCKQILESQSNSTSGVYQISVGPNQVASVYCQMSSVSGCSGGGWTMVMKINGSKSTFRYSSTYWTNKTTYHDNAYGRNGGFDNRQFKGSTYSRTSFNEICVAMKYGGRLRAFSFSYQASSLYDLIAGGNYRATHIGRSQWKQLIHGSSLQYNCNKEGFNIQHTPRDFVSRKIRLGIMGNNENDCRSPDSYIGLGGEGEMNFCGSSNSLNTAGNVALCSSDNGNRDTKAMGYILVR